MKAVDLEERLRRHCAASTVGATGCQQATAVFLCGASGGTSCAHFSVAHAQRGWKRQP
jgi:hypothetical protein